MENAHHSNPATENSPKDLLNPRGWLVVVTIMRSKMASGPREKEAVESCGLSPHGSRDVESTADIEHSFHVVPRPHPG